MTIRLAALLVLAAITSASADPMPPAPPDDPIGDHLFPPDLVMAHQGELGLSAAQRTAIVTEIQRFQTTAVKLQWDLKTQGDALAALLAAPALDEPRVLAQADAVMALEHDLKRAHLTLLVRLRNTLSAAQQQQLRAIRDHARTGGPP